MRSRECRSRSGCFPRRLPPRDRPVRLEGGEEAWTAGALRLGSGSLLHGPDLSPEAPKARGEAEVRGGRKEGLHRADRTPVEDAEGHARPAPAAAIGAEDLAATVELGLVHYAHFRPHQGLGGATPAEIYFGRTPTHLSAIPPPRGRPGEGPMDPRFASTTSTRNGCCRYSFEKQPEGRSPGKDVGRRVRARRHRTARALVCARQRSPQFPLRPYRPPEFESTSLCRSRQELRSENGSRTRRDPSNGDQLSPSSRLRGVCQGICGKIVLTVWGLDAKPREDFAGSSGPQTRRWVAGERSGSALGRLNEHRSLFLRTEIQLVLRPEPFLNLWVAPVCAETS